MRAYRKIASYLFILSVSLAGLAPGWPQSRRSGVSPPPRAPPGHGQGSARIARGKQTRPGKERGGLASACLGLPWLAAAKKGPLGWQRDRAAAQVEGCCLRPDSTPTAPRPRAGQDNVDAQLIHLPYSRDPVT